MSEDVRGDLFRLVKFCKMIGISAFIDFSVFYTLFSLAGFELLFSHIFGFLCAMFSIYVINRRRPFDNQGQRVGWLGAFIFISVSFLGLGLGTLALLMLVKYGAAPVVAKLIAIGVTLLWSFCFYQGQIFQKRFIVEADK